jgi:hypothetical protein
MTNKLLTILVLLASISYVSAQDEPTDSADSTHKYMTGFAVYAEVGLLSNKSFNGIRDRMNELNIKPFERVMASVVLAKRMESEKFFMESRLILMNSTKHNNDDDIMRGMFRGIGLGVDASPKFVNSTRWNVLVPIGWDIMLYQLRVKNNQSATLGQVIQNPNTFKSVKMYNGSINLHGGVGVDYKMNLFPKVYEKVYISAKATYHLPVFRRGQWRGDDVKVTDLPSFKANQLYAQLGLVFFPKKSNKMWHKMH